VDLYRLLTFPVVVGAGKRLFEHGARPSSFQAEESQTTTTGVTALTLRPTEFRIGDVTVADGEEVTV